MSLSIILAGILLTIYSCQKDVTVVDNPENTIGQSTSDAQLEKRIISFREKIDLIRENPSLKTGTDPMEVDSAIWYIESTANLTYGDASPEMDGFVTDSAFLSVPLTNGLILWTDVQIAYDQVIDILSDHYDAIIASEKQLVVADVSLVETLSSSVVLKVNSGIATNTTGSPAWGANDHSWYWGWELGTCDGSGIGGGYDAADKIAELANILVSVPSGNSYYTDPENVYTSGCQHANSPEDCLFDDFQEYTLVHPCLSPTEISSYRTNVIALGAQLKPSSEYSVIHYTLYDDFAAASCGPDNHDCWYLIHTAKIKYGIWHVSSSPPQEL